VSRRTFEHLIPIELDFQCENASIVVIDDEALMTRFVKHCLEKAGFKNVICFNDPSFGLEQIRRIRPDLILLDLVMPKISGLDMLEFIKNDEELDETTVLVLSAADKKSKYRALNLGAIDFINKPVDEEDLELRVRKALRVI
jgi:DNA-binding response OmpR family regulator